VKGELSDEQVIEAWRENAAPWTDAVRGKKIESRNLVTDAAIFDAVMSCKPRTALDIGCGEGWLARALAERGVKCTGVDVVPELVEKARNLGGGDFRVLSYEEMGQGNLALRFDVAVANFSLIGGEAVDALISRVPDLLEKKGRFIVQTPHPVIATGDVPYADGWREGSWAGCGDNFSRPAPWYFRTLESWVKLIRDSGLQLAELREPMHPVTRRPASLILIAESLQ
jgi:2-polyprenyl-3-methyl-5-hydroxy-6-metoxy-1,4-benzoquinol methylase